MELQGQAVFIGAAKVYPYASNCFLHEPVGCDRLTPSLHALTIICRNQLVQTAKRAHPMMTTNVSATAAAPGEALPIVTRVASGQQLSRLACQAVAAPNMARNPAPLNHAVEMMHAQAAMFTAAAGELDDARREHPSWFAAYDDGALEHSSAADLMELMNTAPNSFTRGMVYGAFMARIELAAATGGEF